MIRIVETRSILEESDARANRNAERGNTPRADLRELVRKTVEDTLNGLLEEEAGNLVGAERETYRTGHYDRSLTTSSGEVTIRIPKLKRMRFATTIIERYWRRETSVEKAIIEMYLASVSAKRIEDVNEILWARVCPPPPSSTSTRRRSRRSRSGATTGSTDYTPTPASTASISRAPGKDPTETRP